MDARPSGRAPPGGGATLDFLVLLNGNPPGRGLAAPGRARRTRWHTSLCLKQYPVFKVPREGPRALPRRLPGFPPCGARKHITQARGGRQAGKRGIFSRRRAGGEARKEDCCGALVRKLQSVGNLTNINTEMHHKRFDRNGRKRARGNERKSTGRQRASSKTFPMKDKYIFICVRKYEDEAENHLKPGRHRPRRRRGPRETQRLPILPRTAPQYLRRWGA